MTQANTWLKRALKQSLYQGLSGLQTAVLIHMAKNCTISTLQHEMDLMVQYNGKSTSAKTVCAAPGMVLPTGFLRTVAPIPNQCGVCPICHEQMLSIFIADNRPCYYCEQHRLCLPQPIADGTAHV